MYTLTTGEWGGAAPRCARALQARRFALLLALLITPVTLTACLGTDRTPANTPESISAAWIPVSAHLGEPSDYPTVYHDIDATGGRIVFASRATNLGADPSMACGYGGQDYPCQGLYLWDVESKALQPLQKTTDGRAANNDSTEPVISGNGQRVAFVSFATNLHPDDSDPRRDIYVLDLDSDELRWATRPLDSAAAHLPHDACPAICGRVSISHDGEIVVFDSDHPLLVERDLNAERDVFAYQWSSRQIMRASTDSDGQEVQKTSWNPGTQATDAGGNLVAFQQTRTSLVAAPLRGVDVYMKNMADGALTLVSAAGGDTAANGNSGLPAVSATGSHVAFASEASNLSPADTNNVMDVFLYDVERGGLELASVASSGDLGNGASWVPAVSGDGRYVVFVSSASNLVTGDDNGVLDVFLRDMSTGKTHLVSRGYDGKPGNAISTWPSISDDGRYVVLRSEATNLVPGFGNGESQIYIRSVSDIVGS